MTSEDQDKLNKAVNDFFDKMHEHLSKDPAFIKWYNDKFMELITTGKITFDGDEWKME